MCLHPSKSLVMRASAMQHGRVMSCHAMYHGRSASRHLTSLHEVRSLLCLCSQLLTSFLLRSLFATADVLVALFELKLNI